MAMIEFQDVSKTYDESQAGPISAVSDVSFAVEEGEFVSIVGASGCGKTTLLRILMGLIEASKGTVWMNGMIPAEARVRRIFGVVFQEPALLPWRTVLDNVRLPLEITRRAGLNPMDLVHQLGLQEFEFRYPHELSGGMQQRVAVGRALVLCPRVLLMDEPFGSLDNVTRHKMYTWLLPVWRSTNVTTLFVTHNIQEAAYLSDRVIVLTKRPARVAKIIPTRLSRPRNPEIMNTQPFWEFTQCIAEELG